jgi:hypothetical protein
MRVHRSNACLLVAAACTDVVNAIAEASRHATPPARTAQVASLTLPPRGSMQCVTPTTESPNIAATSTARAPTCGWAGSRANGTGLAAATVLAGLAIALGGAADAACLGAVLTATIGACFTAAMNRFIGGGAGSVRTDSSGPASLATGDPLVTSDPLATRDPLATTDSLVTTAPRATLDASGTTDPVGTTASGAPVPVPRRTAAGSAGGRAALRATCAAASPITSSIRVSPSMIESPDCSIALLIFLPLTNVPRVEPRSIKLTSPPVTSTIACMRLTASSSIRRCAEGTLPILITPWVRVSSRTS